jgi:DNA-binding CsgD family transcriptional regulator
MAEEWQMSADGRYANDNAQRVCPHCGQRLLTHHGVRLSPQETNVYDMISQGCGSLPQLCAALDKTRGLVRTHIHNINVRFRATDFAIVSDGRRPPNYRVANVRAQKEAA